MAAAAPAIDVAWLQMLAGFLAGVGATWYLLKGRGPNTRQDILGRFKVRSRRWVKPIRGKDDAHRQGGQRKGQRYQLSVLDKLVCPETVINMHYFYDATLDARKLEESLIRLVTDQPFLAGTLRGWLQTACVVCDDAGVEFTVADASWTLEDVHYSSPALDRASQYEPCGFGAGDPSDVLRAVIWRAPVMRARVTYLRGGGTCVSVSLTHTVMDAKSTMKVVEMWARRARDAAGTASAADSENEDGVAEVFLRPPTLDHLVSSTEVAARAPHPHTLYEFANDAFHGLRQCLVGAQLFLVDGLETRTFFFPDEQLASLKKDVMRRLQEMKAQQPSALDDSDSSSSSSGSDSVLMTTPATGTQLSGKDAQLFVSTNDVLCATVWKAIQGLKSRPSGPSQVHMNVDVRGILMPPAKAEQVEQAAAAAAAAAVTAVGHSHSQDSSSSSSSSSNGGDSSSHRSHSGSGSSTPPFLLGNGVMQCQTRCDDPAVAPVHDLATLIRQGITRFDEAEVSRRLGFLKKKETHGIFLGPLGLDWRFSHDVIFSSFHPLQSDHDFGAGPAFLYQLDLLPNLAQYIHIHKGSDSPAHEWLPRGLYAQVTLPRPCMEELMREHPDFTPVTAPRRRPSQPQATQPPQQRRPDTQPQPPQQPAQSSVAVKATAAAAGGEQSLAAPVGS